MEKVWLEFIPMLVLESAEVGRLFEPTKND